MNLNNREEGLTIYLPEKNKQNFLDILNSAQINCSFNITVVGIKKEQIIYSDKNLNIESVKLDHTISTFGFIFKIKDTLGKFNREKALKLKIPEGPLFSKLSEGKSIKINGKVITPNQVIDTKFKKIGKKILYLTDTKIIPVNKKLLDSDILIHECTFGKEEEKKANLVKHSTSVGVAGFAKKIKAKHLYLVHISSRYQETDNILTESSKLFKNTMIPKDLDTLEIDDY
jgi:ribonuclease Z